MVINVKNKESFIFQCGLWCTWKLTLNLTKKDLKRITKISICVIVFVIVLKYYNCYNRFDSTSWKLFKLKLKGSQIITPIDTNHNYSSKFITTYHGFKSMKRRFKRIDDKDVPRYSKNTICKLNITTLGSQYLGPIHHCLFSGPILVNKTELELKWVEVKHPEIRGGFYAPTNCRARYKVAILVPYRNRERNLIIFLNHMHTFLKKQLLEYRVFVIEQFGTKKFNKGTLYNVGFLESQRYGDWHCLVFHDVDLLPLDERILYSCPRKPTHMSSAVESNGYRLQYNQLFGGVTALTPAQFEAVNGYSNLYWDWGAEDDDMFIRLQARRFPVLRYDQSIARYAALPHENSRRNGMRLRVLRYAKRRFRLEGLNTVKYVLINSTERKLFTHFVADINPFYHSV